MSFSPPRVDGDCVAVVRPTFDFGDLLPNQRPAVAFLAEGWQRHCVEVQRHWRPLALHADPVLSLNLPWSPKACAAQAEVDENEGKAKKSVHPNNARAGGPCFPAPQKKATGHLPGRLWK